MKKIIHMLIITGVLALTAGSAPAETGSRQWITPEEAALPNKKTPDIPPPGALAGEGYHPIKQEQSAGPIIRVEKPQGDSGYKGKLDIEILFEKNPLGEDVDMNSLKVIYLKLFNINITDRILPYVKGQRITARKIDFPSGSHNIMIKIRDREQMETRKTFSINVK